MAQSGNQELVDRFIQFYRNYYRDEIGTLAQNYPDEQRSLYIDYEDLYQFDRDLTEDYLNQPEMIREYAEEAIRIYDLPADVRIGNANIRINNLPTTTPLEEIRSKHINQLVQLQGTVAGTSTVRTRFTDTAHECQRCGTLNYIPHSTPQSKAEVEGPEDCQACEKSGPFKIKPELSDVVDTQTIVLEQQIRGVGDSGDIDNIEVKLADDIVGEMKPGDSIVVTGIIKFSDEPLQTTIPDKYLEATSITDAELNEHIEIGTDDIERIVDLSNQSSIYEDIVGSIAPSIYGCDEEKLAIVLQLFSGIQKSLPDGSMIRGDVHVLLVGDPGTAKSELIRAGARLAPRAVTVSGTSTSTVGLTAAATKSSGNTDPWEIKGGALVKANNGLAVIDNIDGFDDDQFSGLHSSLEQQEINVSKASITETLPAKTSVLAAANPKYGQFDQYEPIGEQLDISPDVISQFDLIFVSPDQPDRDDDAEIAEHIIDKNHAGQVSAQRSQTHTAGFTQEEVDEVTSAIAPKIELDLLRKYIAYAQRSCFPTLTDGAKDVIKEFYVDIRSNGVDEDTPVSVTARKLEALVRLAEASARMRLSDTIEVEDAERVVTLVRSNLQDIGIDPEAGKFDADVVETGSPKRNQDETEIAKKIVGELESEHEGGAPMNRAVKQIASVTGSDESKAEAIIEKARRTGDLYEPKQGHLRST